MDKNVFLSILAMDSYNRGSFAGIKDLSKAGSIGLAGISGIDLPQDSVVNGFEATAYSWGDKIVISYRGTDFNSFDQAELDIWAGWSAFTGFGSNKQFELAKQFYIDVTGADFVTGAGIGPANVILTGHSLGGGLAGYIGARAKPGETIVTDPIPYGKLAWESAITDALSATLARLVIDPLSLATEIALGSLIPGTSVLIDDFVKTFGEELSARAPDLGQVQGYSVAGEIAASIVPLQLTVGELLSFFTSTGQTLLSTALITALVEDRSNIATLPNYGAALDPITLHSAALPAIILYGQNQWQGGIEWQAGIHHVLAGIFDDAIAEALGRVKSDAGVPESGTGNAAPAEQLARIIAYSAIDEGEKPFGDTGIAALFDDATDLGRALNGGAPASLRGAAAASGKFVAEFAGLMAVNGITDQSRPEAKKGALSLSVVDRPSSQTLVFDLRDTTWTVSGAAHVIQTRHDLVSAFLGDGAIGAALMNDIDAWYKHAAGHMDIVADIDRIAVALTANTRLTEVAGDGVTLSVLNDAGSRFSATGATDFVIGGLANDTINGWTGDDILIGGGGDDVLDGGAGSDLLIGGAGNDRIDGASGDDVIMGGEGEDFLYGGNGNDDIYTGAVLGGAYGGSGSDLIVLRAADATDPLTFLGGDLSYGAVPQLQGNDGNDKIVVMQPAIVMAAGGKGNDIFDIQTNSGQYAYVFAAGDGRDVINLPASPSSDGITYFGFALYLQGITSGQLSFRWNITSVDPDYRIDQQDGIATVWTAHGDLAISVDGTNDTLLIRNVSGSIGYHEQGDGSVPQIWPGMQTSEVLVIGFDLAILTGPDHYADLSAARYSTNGAFDSNLHFSLGPIGAGFARAEVDFVADRPTPPDFMISI